MADKSLKSVKTRIVCVKKEVKQTTESGIYLGAGQTSEQDQWAVITYVGPDVKSDLAVGDEIVPMWNTVGVITVDEKKFYIVDEANVMGVMK